MNNNERSQEMLIAGEMVGDLILAANSSGLVVFAGAGISVPAPSSCPTWIALRNEIITAFFDKLIRENWPTKPYLEQSKIDIRDHMKLRPETFMWSLVSNIGLERVLAMIQGMDNASPNFNHGALAVLAKERITKAIVTTNFDTYIERSLENMGSKYDVARDEAESGAQVASRGDHVLIFKPHGCLSKPSSMEYRIDQIQSLPEHKRRLLPDLLASAPVLVVGYSGNDEDIFPVMCTTLAASHFGSYICVYPGSPKDEPIQQWDISGMPHIHRFYADPTGVLGSMAVLLSQGKITSSDLGGTTNQRMNVSPFWKENISLQVEKIPHDIIAISISHLCSLSGNHRRSLSFAHLAQDICEDTNLSHTPQKSLLFIRELRSRASKELPEYKGLIENLSGALTGNDFEWDSYRQVVDNLLEDAHVALRNNNLESAERNLSLVAAQFEMSKIESLERAGYSFVAFLWYTGILKRKQSKPRDADEYFDRAIAITHAQNDIIHGGRILLDYGYVKCQVNDWESAQQVWGRAVELAKQANDWDTAAKAAKNRGILLSVSDKPHLARPELERSLLLFTRAGDHEGAERAKEALRYSEQDFISVVMNWSKNESSRST